MYNNQRRPTKAVVIKDSLFISGATPGCPLFKILTPDTLQLPSYNLNSVGEVGGRDGKIKGEGRMLFIWAML